jgi:hypothetical protein
MEEFRCIRGAVLDPDGLADKATYQRLLKGFQAEEAAGYRRRFLYGDERIERPAEKIPCGD